jgi:hypothetical protein
MNEANIIIVSHTVDYTVMSTHSVEEQEKEIENYLSTLERFLGSLSVKFFFYPHGAVGTG